MGRRCLQKLCFLKWIFLVKGKWTPDASRSCQISYAGAVFNQQCVNFPVSLQPCQKNSYLFSSWLIMTAVEQCIWRLFIHACSFYHVLLAFILLGQEGNTVTSPGACICILGKADLDKVAVEQAHYPSNTHWVKNWHGHWNLGMVTLERKGFPSKRIQVLWEELSDRVFAQDSQDPASIPSVTQTYATAGSIC